MLYAISDESATRALVEAALSVRFELHESHFLGGDYWLATPSAEAVTVRIRPNLDLQWAPGDPESERYAYPDFPSQAWLLEVLGGSGDIAARLSAVECVELLRAGQAE